MYNILFLKLTYQIKPYQAAILAVDFLLFLGQNIFFYILFSLMKFIIIIFLSLTRSPYSYYPVVNNVFWNVKNQSTEADMHL